MNSALGSFAYTEAQQRAILCEVCRGCQCPFESSSQVMLGLSQLMLGLQKAANAYLDYKPHYMPPIKRISAARARAREAEKFRAIVVRAEATPLDPWPDLVNDADRTKFLGLLDRFKRCAELEAEATEELGGPGRPIDNFFIAIFNEWGYAGGAFACSRNARTGVPDGPLVRFVQAVMKPVMGKNMPAPETIYAMIRDVVKTGNTAGQ
jgi:hypothetical protein